MDAEFQGLLWTVGIDLLFFIGCLSVYNRVRVDVASERRGSASRTEGDEQESLLQKYESNVKANLEHQPASDPFFNPMWAKVFGKLPVDNSAAFLYLRFMEMTILCLASLTIVFTPVLLPIYVAGQHRYFRPTWLQITSAGNVPAGQNTKLWVVFLAAIFGSCIAYWVVWAFLESVKHLSAKVAVSVKLTQKERAIEERQHHTVHLSGLDPTLTDERALKEYFNAYLPGKVVFVSIALNVVALSRAVQQKRTAKKALERVNQIRARHGRTVRVGGCCGLGGGAAADYYEQKVAEANEVISAQRGARPRGTGHAFIVFHDVPSLDALVPPRNDGPGPTYSPDYGQANWVFRMAPPPSDINWDNLNVSDAKRFTRGMMASLALFFTMLVLITPVALLQTIEPLLKSVKNNIFESPTNPIRVLITHYTPALAVFLINSAILPVLIDKIAQFERHYLRSMMERSIFKRNHFYMMLTVILIPTLALNSIAAFIQLTYNTEWTEWNQVLGSALLSSSGHFAIQYVIHAGLLGGGSMLLDLPQTTARRWKRWNAVTEAEFEEANEPWQFEFGYWYANRMTVFGLVLVYSAIVPLILPFGLIYAILIYKIDRFNFKDGFYHSDFQSNGKLEAIVARGLLIYVALFQFFMAGFFVAQHIDMYYTLGALLTLASIFTVFMYLSPAFDYHPEKTKHISNDDVPAGSRPSLIVETADEVSDSDASVDHSSMERLAKLPLWQVYMHPLRRTVRTGQTPKHFVEVSPFNAESEEKEAALRTERTEERKGDDHV